MALGSILRQSHGAAMHFLRSFQEICKSRDLPSLLPAPSHAGPGFDVYAGRLLGCEGSRQHSLLSCVKGKEESSKGETKGVFLLRGGKLQQTAHSTRRLISLLIYSCVLRAFYIGYISIHTGHASH